MAKKSPRKEDPAQLHKQVRTLTKRYQAVANPDRLLILAMVDLVSRTEGAVRREDLKRMVTLTRARPNQSVQVDFHLKALMRASLVKKGSGRNAGYSSSVDSALREEILPLERIIAQIVGR